MHEGHGRDMRHGTLTMAARAGSGREPTVARATVRCQGGRRSQHAGPPRGCVSHPSGGGEGGRPHAGGAVRDMSMRIEHESMCQERA